MAETVVDRLRASTAALGGRIALIEADAQWTYAELFERTDRLAAALHALGVRKGHSILALLPNAHEAVECELAALSSGIAWITLTSRLTWAEVRGVVTSCAPKLLFTTPDGARTIAEGLAVLPLHPMPDLVVTGSAGMRLSRLTAVAYEPLLASHAPARPAVAVAPEDTARLRYTSGTTGSAKAAVLSHRNYHASLDGLLAELGPITESDRVLHVAPLTHGSGALLHPILFAGGTSVLAQRFDVDDVLSQIERHRISMMFTVPTMLSRLVASPRFDCYDLSSLRALIYGGAPMPAAQLEAAIAKIGRALHQIYGMTEAPWPITMLKPEDHVAGSPRLRSVGRATKACKVRVVDPEGRTLAVNDVGEIQVQGPNVMRGYQDDDDGTRAVLGGGWLSTGDLGRIDENGYVFIVARRKDVIISGGFNVYAAEVEAVLSAHDGVLEVAVVGVPDDGWGELVTAFVVPKPGASLVPSEIEEIARSRLSGYKCPRRIEIVAELPKNASGKIQKSEIRRRAIG